MKFDSTIYIRNISYVVRIQAGCLYGNFEITRHSFLTRIGSNFFHISLQYLKGKPNFSIQNVLILPRRGFAFVTIHILAKNTLIDVTLNVNKEDGCLFVIR